METKIKALLCAIAKNEDDYIDEWIDYNLKLGFDRIVIYANNWDFTPDVRFGGVVDVIKYDTNSQFAQTSAYNDCIKRFQDNYDWIAFFDIDEFLTLVVDADIHEFLARYSDFQAVGVNWRMFGDSGIKNFSNDNTSVLNRFTMSAKSLNKHIKSIVHVSMAPNNFMHICAHCTNLSMRGMSTINVSGKSYVNGPTNTEDLDECANVAYLNHYMTKTYDEYICKCKRNQAGIQHGMDYISKLNENFAMYNTNEVEDTRARNFYNGRH